MTRYRMSPGSVICGYSVSSLRTEAKRGNLVIMRIAGKDYVSEEAIREMERRCERESQQGYGLRSGRADRDSGLSLMERKRSALAAAKEAAKRLSSNLQSTSAENSNRTHRQAI